jgi:hypothetical protein
LVSNRVFKIGSNIKGDITRLQKQFPQLVSQTTFNVIELKEYCIERGVISRKESGALDKLLEKTTHMYLSKDNNLQRNDGWESRHIPPDMLQYATLDVYASRIIFEAATTIAPVEYITHNTPHGTRVVILVQEGGATAAYGKIAASQPKSLGSVRVATPSKNRLVVDVDEVICPSAAAILHLLPETSPGKTKAGALTYDQLRAAISSSDNTFQAVIPISLLGFDRRNMRQGISESTRTLSADPKGKEPETVTSRADENFVNNQSEDHQPDFLEPQNELDSESLRLEAETIEIEMLEAQALVEKGILHH